MQLKITTEREEYLIKALRAEHAAAKFAPDSTFRRDWHKVAERYWHLARLLPAKDGVDGQ
jgi:hypothetical protein